MRLLISTRGALTRHRGASREGGGGDVGVITPVIIQAALLAWEEGQKNTQEFSTLFIISAKQTWG